MDTKNKEAEAKTLEPLRETHDATCFPSSFPLPCLPRLLSLHLKTDFGALIRLSFHVHLLTFPVRSRLSREEKKNPIAKKNGFDDILNKIHSSVQEFEAAVDTCRDQHIETTRVKVNEVLHVSIQTSDQVRDLGDQSSNRFDKLDQGLLKCTSLLHILLQSREEATEGLRMLLSQKQKGKYIHVQFTISLANLAIQKTNPWRSDLKKRKKNYNSTKIPILI